MRAFCISLLIIFLVNVSTLSKGREVRLWSLFLNWNYLHLFACFIYFASYRVVKFNYLVPSYKMEFVLDIFL